VTGQLFVRSDAEEGGMSPPWRYLALYDLEADDIAEYLRHEQATRERGALRPNGGTMDPEYAVWIYSELGPRVARIATDEAAAPAPA
jgi:hypothetical protein